MCILSQSSCSVYSSSLLDKEEFFELAAADKRALASSIVSLSLVKKVSIILSDTLLKPETAEAGQKVQPQPYYLETK
ncbi:TPA: hypothetical protein ACGO6Q_001659 [Streptococcus suis]